MLQRPHEKLELWSDVTVLAGVCSPQGCVSGTTCYTTTVVHSGAPIACMPLRVMHCWLKSTAVWECVAIVLFSLALQAPVIPPSPLFFFSVAELIPQGSGVLRAFISKSVKQLLLVSLHIYHLKDAHVQHGANLGGWGGDKQLFCESRETGLFSSSWYRSRIPS